MATSRTAPIGTLTRKIQRQPFSSPKAAMSSPPRTGPIAEDTETVNPNSPNATPRSEPRNSDWMSPELCGVSSPAARPWTSRAATRTATCGARPAAALERTKPARPMSITAPPVGVAEAASADEHEAEGEGVAGDDPLHGARRGVEPAAMEGMATLTIVTSSRTMKPTASVTPRTRHRRGSGASSGVASVRSSVSWLTRPR